MVLALLKPLATSQDKVVVLALLKPLATSQDKIVIADPTLKSFRSLRILIGTLVFWLSRNLKVAIEASLAVFGLVERIGGGQSASAICAT